MERGVPIRAITRGIAALSAISRDGPITMMNISKSASIPYPTACRIVQTLIHEGLVEREPSRKRYRVTSVVQTLATGFQSEDQLVAAARPHLEKLCTEVRWPISLVTRVGTHMMVRDSTHKMTSLTFTNYYPGYTLPIAESAAGKAYLAHCSKEERQTIVEAWQATDNESSKMGLSMLSDNVVLDRIRSDGFALQARNFCNEEPGKTSSLAVPVNDINGKLVGSLALIFFAAALKPEQAVVEFLPNMQKTTQAIAASM